METPTTDQSVAIVANYMPVLNIEAIIARRKAIVEFTKAAMVDGTDYGVIPGAGDKKTLLKPGAEKLCTLFGLTPRFVIVSKTEDWTGSAHNGEAMFAYQYSCQLYRGAMLVAEGVGSCNSFEKKYRYREGKRVCPNCNKETIIKGRAEYGGGWVCYSKKGGCGSKFQENAPEIVNQVVGQIPNPDVADVVNTIDKMAQKRALIAAVLIAVNASEFFTQDMEDFDTGGAIDGDFKVVDSDQRKPEQKQATTATTTSDDAWKKTLAEALTKATSLIRNVTKDTATNLNTVIAYGRETLRKNGHSSADERKRAIDELMTAIKTAEAELEPA